MTLRITMNPINQYTLVRLDTVLRKNRDGSRDCYIAFRRSSRDATRRKQHHRFQPSGAQGSKTRVEGSTCTRIVSVVLTDRNKHTCRRNTAGWFRCDNEAFRGGGRHAASVRQSRPRPPATSISITILASTRNKIAILRDRRVEPKKGEPQ